MRKLAARREIFCAARRARRRLLRGRLCLDRSGSALVEFALITPVAFLFIALVVIIGEGMEALGKTSLTARTVAYLVSEQNNTLPSASLDCMITAASQVMAPFSTTGLSVVVSEVLVKTGGTTAVVQWSQAASFGGTALKTGSTVTVPNGYLPAGTYQILAQVQYNFSPIYISFGPLTTFNFTRSLYIEPRNGSSIALD